MKSRLTSVEMSGVYDQLEKEGKANQPYIIHYKTPESQLTFFGSVHTADPESPEWASLEDEWRQFIDQENPKKVVIYEKAGSDIYNLTREEAIIQHGETGLALWLARKSDVKAISPQVNQLDAVKALQSKGFTTKEIMTYYFARQMHQWARQDKEIAPDWQEYMQDTVKHYNELQCWDEDITLDKVLGWFTEKIGKAFNEHDIESFYNVSDPSQNPVSDASGIEQDTALQQAINRYMNSGSDVFVVYGSGHAIRLEPVLDDSYQKISSYSAK